MLNAHKENISKKAKMSIFEKQRVNQKEGETMLIFENILNQAYLEGNNQNSFN